jgi:hypothetical protein
MSYEAKKYNNLGHALVYACGIGNLTLVDKLLKQGANPSFSCSKLLPWEKAIVHRNYEIADYIVETAGLGYITSTELAFVIKLCIDRTDYEGLRFVLKYHHKIPFRWIKNAISCNSSLASLMSEHSYEIELVQILSKAVSHDRLDVINAIMDTHNIQNYAQNIYVLIIEPCILFKPQTESLIKLYVIISNSHFVLPEYINVFEILVNLFWKTKSSHEKRWISHIFCTLIFKENFTVKHHIKELTNIMYYEYHVFLILSALYCKDVIHCILKLLFLLPAPMP